MRNKLLWYALLAALPMAAGNTTKIAPDLKASHGPARQEIDVIVQFTTTPSEQHHLQVAAKGARLRTRFGGLRAAAYTTRGDAIEAIAALPEVTYISYDRPVRGQLDYSAAAVNANLAWSYGWSGRGIGIAIVDSGIAASAGLQRRVVYSESFVHLNGAQDHYGHGTHVAGIAADNGSGSGGRYRGIAPQASLINLRVLDDTGMGSDSTVIAAIARAIEIKDIYGIRVLNLSLGRAVYESYRQDPLCQAVEAAWKAGIVVVVAAGNNGRNNAAGTQGYGTITAPGNDPYVLTVGAMKSMGTYARGDDLIASYSSKGPTAIDHIVKPDLVAPGNQVVSDIGTGFSYLSLIYPQNIVQGNYFQLSGTSMAAPVVSAAAALLLEQDSSLTPDQIKARLMMTAAKNFPNVSIATDPQTGASYTSYYDPFTVGAGYLDITAALECNEWATGSAISPTADWDPLRSTVTLSQGNILLWGLAGSWGSAGLSGASVVWGSGLVDAFSVVWGSSTMEAGNSLHGEAISISGEN